MFSTLLRMYFFASLSHHSFTQLLASPLPLCAFTCLIEFSPLPNWQISFWRIVFTFLASSVSCLRILFIPNLQSLFITSQRALGNSFCANKVEIALPMHIIS